MYGRSINSYATEIAVFLKQKVGSSERALKLVEQNERLVKRSFRASVHPLAVAGTIARGEEKGETCSSAGCGPGFT